MWTSKKIRQSFIDFFKSKNHTEVPSAPIYIKDDPTLLFTNAGMNQFKDIFLNKIEAPYSRAADTQKCFRVSGKHNDLEEVGKDTTHHTFFEMLGNWSFGDYYKKEAIQWAWELITEVWKLPKEKLYATVFTTDDEAFDIWKNETDIDNSHILRFGEKDNFWMMGDTGPCGPCSEIHIDLGGNLCRHKHIEHQCEVNGDCGRFIEIWNLVFMQYDQQPDGRRVPLPNKHVDTGAGFERITALLQNKNSNYDTDLFMPIIEKIEEMTDFKYHEKPVPFRVIADHIRALTVTISDGVLPGNEGRGYVIRRILRRAARFGRILELKDPFIYKLAGIVVDILGSTFPEIKEKSSYTAEVIKSEEERFNATLDRGIELFNTEMKKLKEKADTTVFPGTTAFVLHDTYGFPFDLTRLMAEEEGFSVDEKEFKIEMSKQKERSKSGNKFSADLSGKEWIILNNTDEDSIFRAYEYTNLLTYITKFRKIDEDRFEIVLNETPFYGESGGQVGDTGTIFSDHMTFTVEDTQKEGNTIIHIGKLEEGEISKEPVYAKIDSHRRKRIIRNHTATHLLHAALRKVLGGNVEQKGSYVGPDRLRFDFSFFRAMDKEEIIKVEEIVNRQILLNRAVSINLLPIEKAKEKGAMALFGEKYGEVVRVVGIEDYSLEFCGGTHAKRTGELGLFKIVHETAISAGIRRIEAVTGEGVLHKLYSEENLISSLSNMLKTPSEHLENKIEKLNFENVQLSKEIGRLKEEIAKSKADKLLDNTFKIKNADVLVHSVKDLDKKEFNSLGDSLSDKLQNGIIIVINITGDKAGLMVRCGKEAQNHGFKAGNIMRSLAQLLDGKGGGNPGRAMGGADNIDKINDFINDKEKFLMKIL